MYIFNVVIPAIKPDNLLRKCLGEIKKAECHGQYLLKTRLKKQHQKLKFGEIYIVCQRLSKPGRTSVKGFKTSVE